MAAADKPSSADAVKARLVSAGFNAPPPTCRRGTTRWRRRFRAGAKARSTIAFCSTRMRPGSGSPRPITPNSKYKVYWAMVVAADKLGHR